MSGKVVNLRIHRKRKARIDARAQADARAAAHGIPKTVRDLADARNKQHEQRLDGLRKSTGEEDD